MLRSLLVIFAISALSQTARAGDVLVVGSLEANGTTWDTDAAGYSTLALDYRRTRWSLSFTGKLGYGSVDERLLEYLDLGGKYWLRTKRTGSYIRLGLFHQHEIPRESVDANLSAILGVGDGIRHRAGMSIATGILIDLTTYKHGVIFASAHLNAAYGLENQKGPSWYWGGGLGLGFSYDFSKSPVQL